MLAWVTHVKAVIAPRSAALSESMAILFIGGTFSLSRKSR
jgi:hypothetical protein